MTSLQDRLNTETQRNADFRNWLNRKDALLGYECRRRLRTVKEWRVIFDSELGLEDDDAFELYDAEMLALGL